MSSPKKTDKNALREADKRLSLLMWYKYLRETSNDAFFPLFSNTSRYLVLKGGGGSGKSIFAGRKILERCVSEHGHRFLVCRKVGKTLRQSCFRQLIGQIIDNYPDVKYTKNESDMVISFPETGSEILFSGLDDVEKLKSIYNITGIWIEEASELLESDFNQLDIRLRGETRYYKQIIITFNPISMLHWLKRRFFDAPPENATVHESNYHDNRFLDEDNKKVLEGYKDTDEYYYMVYCLGQWGVTGKTVFDARKISARIDAVMKDPPLKRTGRMVYDYDGVKVDAIGFEDDDRGFLRIYREPEEGHSYILGADTAGDGSDSAVAQVVDAVTMEQVAVLRDSDIDEDLFARQIYSLGKWYNDALIAVEANFSTYPILELERLRYPYQYVREVFDDATHKVQIKYGFQTNAKTRPVLISNLQQIVREHTDCLNDLTTMEEMLTFVRNPDTYKPEAEEGAHDDTIMALGIAYLVRDSGQARMPARIEETKTEWTEDMYDDYEAAAPDEKEILLRKWGKPKRWK